MMKRIRNSLLLLIICFSTSFTINSCDTKDNEYEWEWDKGEDKEDEQAQGKPRYIWIDAAANFPDFANSRENIIRDLTLAKETGFTDIVVDVRPTDGDVLFQTDVVDEVTSLGAWLPEGYTAVERTATWDYLQAFIEEGHELDLKVHAAINTFSGGSRNSLGTHGMLYRDESKKEWATQLLTEDGIENTLDQNNTGSKFFNPVHEEVQQFLLDLLEDLAAYKELDGIFLDRGRFDGLDSDFSQYTREKFEDHLGYTVGDFPEEVVTPEMLNGGLPSELPIYFKQWLEFRAKTIHDFMEKAQQRVKSTNPDVNFGVYVGGWYSSYYGVGVNWASPEFDTASRYPVWATPAYKDYGYADLMDVILIGAYAAPTNIYGANEWTVQGFSSRAKEIIRGDATVIAGPDVGNGAWATSSDEVVNNAITQSVDAAYNASDGYFLFDMIHLKKKNQWQYVKKGIDQVLE